VSTPWFANLKPVECRSMCGWMFALMDEVCATLGLFAALSHSFQKPAVFDQKPTVPPAAQWKPKAAS
jgi:hypothetical protein